jgi:hypothetical protein
MIRYIDNPSLELQLIALKKDVRNGKLIECIEQEAQNHMISRDPNYIRYI